MFYGWLPYSNVYQYGAVVQEMVYDVFAKGVLNKTQTYNDQTYFSDYLNINY